MEAVVTVICGTILALMQGFLAHRLTQQDRETEKTSKALTEIHVLVNARLDEALDRVLDLEKKLGLSSGEPIPGPPTISTRTEQDPE
jgi:hypothetical protein